MMTSRRHGPRRPAGLSLVEVLLSLAITGMLLGAVAFAMQGSFDSYRENDEISAVTATARSILSKMAHEIRASDETSCTGTSVSILPVADGSGLTRIDYTYSNGNLNYVRTVSGTATTYPLIVSTEKVKLTSFTPSATAGLDVANNNCNKVIKLNLTFTVGDQTFNVTTSAAPRRNQLW